jgi:hypothetical protein
MPYVYLMNNDNSSPYDTYDDNTVADEPIKVEVTMKDGTVIEWTIQPTSSRGERLIALLGYDAP